MSKPSPSIRVPVDVTNPGQFFACCGLLELASRLWPGTEGWFVDDCFYMKAAVATATLECLLGKIASAGLQQLDPDNATSSPIALSDPFQLQLDWWHDEAAGGRALKAWAGRMDCVRIAAAMKDAMGRALASGVGLFDYATVVYDPHNPKKKVEPFYYDSRRGQNAQALDIGFSPDASNMTTLAHPAVEFLCLVGLQRCRPVPTDTRRVFDYHLWCQPIPTPLVPAAIAGHLPGYSGRALRFENAFRTEQKKHKSFLPATFLGDVR